MSRQPSDICLWPRPLQIVYSLNISGKSFTFHISTQRESFSWRKFWPKRKSEDNCLIDVTTSEGIWQELSSSYCVMVRKNSFVFSIKSGTSSEVVDDIYCNMFKWSQSVEKNYGENILFEMDLLSYLLVSVWKLLNLMKQLFGWFKRGDFNLL